MSLEYGLRSERGLFRTVPRITGRMRLVKSVQRGQRTWGGAFSAPSPITAVDVNNSVIRYLSYTNNGINYAPMVPRVELTNSTTVTSYRGTADVATTLSSFEVIEYYPGVIKNIQRGTFIYNAGPKNHPITAVSDITKTELDFLGYHTTFASADISYLTPLIQLTSTTNIQALAGSINSQTIGYQVVEYY